ncbi:MAG: FAD binding domain-containing protein [Gemmobacter sp.]|nr:FAD binding domain-containing protein [Gemmobacter sp.]
MAAYVRPGTLDQALALLTDRPGWTVVAGGTDVYPAFGDALMRADLLDITGISALRGVSWRDGHWRFGALTTWTDLARADLPPGFAALQAAAREVGSPQIQNAGTVAGNIVNASPAADGTVALLALDASVELAGPSGLRVVGLADFVTGVRQVDLRAGELVTAVLVPDPGEGSAFVKLGARRYMVISIAMVAVQLGFDAGRVVRAGVAVGSCSPVARRLPSLESLLIGAQAGDLVGRVTAADADGLAPISDVRAGAAYRAAVVPVLIRRALRQIAEGRA